MVALSEAPKRERSSRRDFKEPAFGVSAFACLLSLGKA